jgi:hypothetical protein
MPGEYGVALPHLFFLSPTYWRVCFTRKRGFLLQLRNVLFWFFAAQVCIE